MSSFAKIAVFSLVLVLCLSVTTANDIAKTTEDLAPILDDTQNTNIVEEVKILLPSYVPHDTIYINENSDFVDLGFPGYGNSTHPYIIEGLEIEVEEYDSCISIYDVNASFIIANCSFSTAYGGDFTIGLMFSNVTNGVVEDCFIQEMMMGMICSDSLNVTLSNCSLSNIEMTALWLNNNTNPVISNCTFESNLQGVMAYETNMTLIENVFVSNQIGLSITSTNSCTVVNNEFESGGITLGGSVISNFIHNFSDNTLDGKPIYYVHSQPSITITGDYGQILIANCSNANVMDNVLDSSANAILIGFSNFTTITNNNITHGLPGIGIFSSYNVTISTCNISLSGSNGISINDGHNATIFDCYFDQGSTGIAVYSGNNVNISYNEIKNHKYGIDTNGENLTISHNTLWINTLSAMRLVGCNYSTISENTITGALGSTVFIGGHDCIITSNTLSCTSFEFDLSNELNLRHMFSGNTLNEKPIIYHYNTTGVAYNGVSVGQIILGKTNSTVLQNLEIGNTTFPIIVAYCDDISMQEINCTNIHNGIEIFGSNDIAIVDSYLKPSNYLPTIVGANITRSTFVVVNDTEFAGFGNQIYIDNSIDILIHNASIYIGRNGITLLNCNNTVVSETSITTHIWGIKCVFGRNCSILDCTLIDNWNYAIDVAAGYPEKPSWTITGNTIQDAYTGIRASDSYFANITHNNITDYVYGIYLDCILNSTIAHNNVSDGTSYGIYSQYAEYSNFTYNRIFWNNQSGFHGDTARCTFYGNTFGGNPTNAEDYGYQNKWDDGVSLGNTWSDYSGSGNYSIPGDAMSVDHYPSYIPDSDPPEISSPEDVTYEVLEDNIYVTWKVRDLGIDSYKIFRNGSLEYENQVSSWEISYNVGGLPKGIYNFTIVVNDTRSNEAWDTVIVTVVAAEGFLYIDSNDDFTALGLPGTGTAEDPYRIENRTIVGDATCIYITDTTAHFVIRNCTLISVSEQKGAGIWMGNVSNGVVEDCYIYLKSKGIYCEESSFIVFANNTVESCIGGTLVFHCENITVANNTISDSAYPMHRTYSMTLTGGITCTHSKNMTFENNFLRNNSLWGIWVYSLDTAIIRNNEFEKCGLVLYGMDEDSIVENNFVNKKPVAYLVDMPYQNLDPDDYGQIILDNCSNSIASNGVILDASIGIMVYASENMTIQNVTLGRNSYTGIASYISYNLTVQNCISYESLVGMYIQFSTAKLYNSTIACNYHTGIASSMSEVEVRDCKIYANLAYGISDSGSGVYYDNIVAWNYQYNAYCDIWAIPSAFDDGISRGNLWSDYDGSGNYYIEESCVDHYPQLITDDIAPTINQPVDASYIIGRNTTTLTWLPDDEWQGWYDIYVDGSWNCNGSWFTSSIEYTPDFSVSGIYNVTVVARDAAGNSVSDTVFVTAILDDTTPPTIDHPADIQYEEGTGGHSVTWVANDVNPSNWTLLHNGTPALTDEWNGGSITVSVDGLPAGVHNMTIIVSDVNGNTVSDTVMVFVTDSGISTPTTTTTTITTTPTTPPIWIPDTMTLTIMISFGLLIVVLAVVLNRRRGRSATFTP